MEHFFDRNQRLKYHRFENAEYAKTSKNIMFFDDFEDWRFHC